jgi:hypothetical protein
MVIDRSMDYFGLKVWLVMRFGCSHCRVIFGILKTNEESWKIEVKRETVLRKHHVKMRVTGIMNAKTELRFGSIGSFDVQSSSNRTTIARNVDVYR